MRPSPAELIAYFKLDPETGNVYPVGSRIKASRNIPAGRVDTDGYRRIKFKGKYYSAGQVIWLLHTGNWPEFEIDHIDRNKLNNRPVNLRDVSRYENEMNKARNVSRNTGYPGISFWHTGSYQVRKFGRHLGCVNSLEAAQKLYNETLD